MTARPHRPRRPLATSLSAVLALALFAVSANAQHGGPQRPQIPEGVDSVWADVVAEWRTAVEEGGVVGASLALVYDGELARHETHGMADLSEGRPVDSRTIYHWASITKTFTAIAIMQLRDRGLISLDDPIVRYVPELRDVHNPFGSMEHVTIRHLMSHSAGFRRSTWPWAGSAEWQPHEPTEWSQLVSMIPYTEIRFEPGSRYRYSNPGFVFLGRVIEKVSGDVYEAYIDKNIFRPLGMRRAYFDVTPWHLRRFRSNHYFVRGGRPEAGGLDFNTGITVSNSGLNAPVADMARYLAFLMESRIEGSDNDAVLSRNSLKEMWEAVVPIGESALGDSSMGLTFFLYGTEGGQVIGHGGGQRAFVSFISLDPVGKVGAISAFNTVGRGGAGPDTGRIQRGTTARIFGDIFPLFRPGG